MEWQFAAEEVGVKWSEVKNGGDEAWESDRKLAGVAEIERDA